MAEPVVDLMAALEESLATAKFLNQPVTSCGLCGHSMEIPCGYSHVWSKGSGPVYLCHADDHDCYHAWTVWNTRPGDPWPKFSCGKDPR